MNDTLAAPELDRVQRGLDDLAALRTDDPGWTRPVFSEPFRASRAVVAGLMRDAGLQVHADGAGNLIGVLPGDAPDAPALVTGSHTDTVLGAGRFDGVVGVLGAIEAAHSLRASGVRLTRDLRVVDFVGEEPNDFGTSCLGSRAVTGHLHAEHLARARDDGTLLGDAFATLGTTGDAATRAAWAPGTVHAFVELHIEQSAVLEQAAATLGVVSSIVGVARFVVEFTGRRDHAGTMSMANRRDAAAAAARAMVAWETLARADGVSVITTGSVELEPGAVNIVPERARLCAEVRSPTTARRVELQHALRAAAAEAAKERGAHADVRWLSEEPAVPADDRVRALIERAARAIGHEPVTVVSGAEHDAAHLAALGPMGMIFVPSRDGRSHCPEEWTDLDAIGVGVQALARTLVDLDGEQWQ